jgi:hypothetical protein
MSISSTTNRNDYTATGSVDTYAYTFRIFDEDDLTITVKNLSNVETTLTKTTHYTVTGVGSLTGGNVVLVNGAFDWIDGDGDLKQDYTITIRRVLDLIQETDIRNQGAFYPEIHEDQFDKLVMIDQQQQDEIDRSIKIPESVDPSSFNGELPAGVKDPVNAGASLIINATSNGWDLGPTVTSIATHEADTTNIHGISDTSLLVTTTGTQTLTNKTYTDAIISVDQQSINQADIATTATITSLAVTKPFNRFTGSTLTEVQGIDATGVNKLVTFHNASSANITFKNQNAGATATNRIITTTGNDLVLKPNQSVQWIYDLTQTRWVIGAGSGGGGDRTIFGSIGSPRTIGATGIAAAGSNMSTTDADQIIFVASAAGEVDVTTNPQIQAGTSVGQEMLIVGTSNDNYILLENGNGLSLNGEFRSLENANLSLFWNGSVWSEKGRRY